MFRIDEESHNDVNVQNTAILWAFPDPYISVQTIEKEKKTLTSLGLAQLLDQSQWLAGQATLNSPAGSGMDDVE